MSTTRKLLTIVLMILLVSLFGCDKEKKEYEELYDRDKNSFLEDNAVSYDNLEEINETIGVNLVIPEIMGKAKDTFSIVDGKVAQYKCLLAGTEFTLRGAKLSLNENISGVLINNEVPFSNNNDKEYKEDSIYKACRFVVNDNQYVVVVKDEGKMDKETFDYVFNQIYEAIVNKESNSMIGLYDEESEKAIAELVNNNDELSFIVTWPSSTSEIDRWTLVIDYANDSINILSGKHEKFNYDDNKNETIVSTVDDEDFGSLEYKDNIFYWHVLINGEETSLTFSKHPIVEKN